jgi:hypothetical protein
VPGQQLALPERGQGGMPLSPGAGSGSPQYSGSCPASPGRGSFSQPGYASDGNLSGLDHRQAPFSAEQRSVTGRPRAAGTSASGQPDITQSPARGAGRHGAGSCRVKPGVPVPVLSYDGQAAPGAARARRPPELIRSLLPDRKAGSSATLGPFVPSSNPVTGRVPGSRCDKLSRLHSAPAVPVFSVLHQGACG